MATRWAGAESRSARRRIVRVAGAVTEVLAQVAVPRHAWSTAVVRADAAGLPVAVAAGPPVEVRADPVAVRPVAAVGDLPHETALVEVHASPGADRRTTADAIAVAARARASRASAANTTTSAVPASTKTSATIVGVARAAGSAVVAVTTTTTTGKPRLS